MLHGALSLGVHDLSDEECLELAISVRTVLIELAEKLGQAMKDALEQAKPCLLEPFVSMQITVPDECMGDVMGDLNSRRAKVEGMDQAGHNQIIRAKVPMAEVLRYAPDLTSMTSGRGSFEMGFSHYEQLPDHLVDKAAQDSKGGKAEH